MTPQNALGEVVRGLCRSATEAWVRGDYVRAEALLEGAHRVIGGGEYMELPVPESLRQVEREEQRP